MKVKDLVVALLAARNQDAEVVVDDKEGSIESQTISMVDEDPSEPETVHIIIDEWPSL